MAEWGYAASNGPGTWAGSYPLANSKRQSPIDIQTSGVQGGPCSPLKIQYNNSCCKSISNTGASFQVSTDGAGTELSGSCLDSTFKLIQFHAHWGHGGTEGSEHTVDGVSYPAELHLVHMNTKYKDAGEAVSKPNGLAVIGIFLKSGKEHASFKAITDLLSKIPNKGDSADIGFNFDPSCFLPGGRGHYFYEGSLSTPPLNECVHWLVMKEPIEISSGQLSAMMSLHSADGKMVDNYRPTQPLHGRQVQKC